MKQIDFFLRRKNSKLGGMTPSEGFVFETAVVVQHTHLKLFFIGFKLVQQTITNFVHLKNLASLIKKMCMRNSLQIFVVL
jgi:hypothetical protein